MFSVRAASAWEGNGATGPGCPANRLWKALHTAPFMQPATSWIFARVVPHHHDLSAWPSAWLQAPRQRPPLATPAADDFVICLFAPLFHLFCQLEEGVVTWIWNIRNQPPFMRLWRRSADAGLCPSTSPGTSAAGAIRNWQNCLGKNAWGWTSIP